MLKIPMSSLHPSEVTLEPLGWGPSSSLENSSCRLQQHPRVDTGASDRPTEQPLGVLGERTRSTGSSCPSSLLQAGTLSAWSYLAPILQMMKLRLRKAQGHTQVAEPGRRHGQLLLPLLASCRSTEGPGSPQVLLRWVWTGWGPSRRRRKSESLNSLTPSLEIGLILQMKKGYLQNNEISCPKSPNSQIAELGFRHGPPPLSSSRCLMP